MLKHKTNNSLILSNKIKSNYHHKHQIKDKDKNKNLQTHKIRNVKNKIYEKVDALVVNCALGE